MSSIVRKLRNWKGSTTGSSTARGTAEQGFALVFTLLLLSLMSLMALAMVLSTSSDMFINGYYKNARGSFYAADSGLNIARQQIQNEIAALLPTGSAYPSNPSTLVTGSNATTILSDVMSKWSSYTSLNAGQAASSWGGQFEITNTAVCTNSLSYSSGSSTTGGYEYNFSYTLCAQGVASGLEQTAVAESGTIQMSISGKAASSQTSFASYGAFIGNFPLCQTGQLVPGTLTGPFFTNGAWEFGTLGTYTFTDTVAQAGSQFGYWIGNNCVGSAAASYTSGGQTVAPKFQGSPGYLLGQNAEALPANDYNQEWAVIDGIGTTTTAPTTSNLSVLKNASGTAYSSTTTSGVYLNYSTSGSVNTVTGGGFLVVGNAGITLSTSGTSGEVYTVVQTSGSTTTTTTVTTSPTVNTSGVATCAGTTTVGTSVSTTSGWGWNQTTTTTTSSNTFSGVPCDNTTGTAATMLYDTGTITSLSGTGQGVAGVNNYEAITVVADGNVDITGDLLYAAEPVTTTATKTTPVDTLIPANNTGQVLGIFTANGNIELSSSYSNSNLEIDASMAAITQNGSYGFGTPGSLNTVTNVGGRIENQANGVNINTMNVYYDRRFSSNSGFAPPWFPSTTITATGATTTTTTMSATRSQWLLKNM
jgi:Tfp pilus assembly protein PilX